MTVTAFRWLRTYPLFTGEYGAQLYGHTKHDPDAPDWSDMKLVLLTHPGIVDSDIWLKCQRKLEKNRQIGNSVSNPTSWLAGKVVCEKCGHTMTTIKGKVNKSGEIRRYFNCTGRSHKKTCTGPKVYDLCRGLGERGLRVYFRKAGRPEGDEPHYQKGRHGGDQTN